MATKKEKDYELLYFFLRYEIMAVILTAVAFALVAIVYVFLDILYIDFYTLRSNTLG